MATNNLLLSSSGALDLNQITTLSQASKTPHIGSINTLNINTEVTQDPTIPTNFNSMRTHDEYKHLINGLDFNFTDESGFTLINTVNICVTVVAYASHASRANQMLIILDAILPRYLKHLKAEMDKVITQSKFVTKFNSSTSQEISLMARLELSVIQKLSCALKTLVNTSDYLTRVYTGPKSEQKDSINVNRPSSIQSKVKGSPTIMPDDDSIRFSDDKHSTNKSNKVS